MPRLKTSISLDERLLAHLDRQAEADGVSRSELIERLCRRTFEDDQPKVEFIRLWAMPTQVIPALSAMSWHDDDGPVELVIRVPLADWEAWSHKRSRSSKAGGA